MKVLIIEDEEEMLQNMKQTLEKECYLVETATDYDSAFLKIGVYEYDCRSPSIFGGLVWHLRLLEYP